METQAYGQYGQREYLRDLHQMFQCPNEQDENLSDTTTKSSRQAADQTVTCAPTHVSTKPDTQAGDKTDQQNLDAALQDGIATKNDPCTEENKRAGGTLDRTQTLEAAITELLNGLNEMYERLNAGTRETDAVWQRLMAQGRESLATDVATTSTVPNPTHYSNWGEVREVQEKPAVPDTATGSSGMKADQSTHSPSDKGLSEHVNVSWLFSLLALFLF